MAWYTTADARRDAERQAALNQQARLLDRPLTSKQVTGLSRAASPSRATDGGKVKPLKQERHDLGALVKHIKAVVHGYDGRISVTEAIGALEIAKLEIFEGQK